MSIVVTTNLTGWFRSQIGEGLNIDSGLFTDHNGAFDPDESGLALGYALGYVDQLKETSDLQGFVDHSVCDPQAFAFFAELRKELLSKAPFSDSRLKDLYWTAVSIVLAQMYKYVVDEQRLAPAFAHE